MQADWQRAARWAEHILNLLLAEPSAPGSFWNVNLPCCEAQKMPEVVYCPLDPNPLPVEYLLQDGRLHYQGNYHGRMRQPGSDVDVCFSGGIAVTQIHLS